MLQQDYSSSFHINDIFNFNNTKQSCTFFLWNTSFCIQQWKLKQLSLSHTHLNHLPAQLSCMLVAVSVDNPDFLLLAHVQISSQLTSVHMLQVYYHTESYILICGHQYHFSYTTNSRPTYRLLNNNTIPYKENNWLPSYGLDPYIVLVFVAQI